MTSTEFEKYKTIIPGLFDYSGSKISLVNSDTSGTTFETGIPSMYSDWSGKKFPIGDMNGIGRLISQAQYFNQNGGYYTYDKNVANSINGYPLGAILKYKDTTTEEIRIVRSLIEENTYDFVENPEYIDNEHWQYVDNVKLSGVRPRLFPDLTRQKTGTLSVGDVITVPQNVIFIIQSGTNTETTSSESAVYVYVDVKKHNEEEFHSAGMLAYIPPISSAYSMFGQSAAFINSTIEKLNKYKAWYSSSPIQLYLSAGDSVQISTNTEFEYSSKYVYAPLTT